MRISKRTLYFITVLTLITFLVGCGTTVSSPTTVSTGNTSSSGAKILLRLGHTLAPESHYQLTGLEFARLVKEKTKGQVDVQVFPQSQLGGEVQMTQALRTGTQEMEITAQAPVENTIKEWAIFDIPYLFDNIDQANKVLQGPVGKKYLDMLKQHNMIGLAWMSVLERNVFTGKKPVKTMDDMKSLKIRVMQSPGYINAYKAVGANPSPLAYNELYLALQQGLVDGADTGPDQFVMDKFTEVSKFYSLTHVHYLPVAIVISKTTWDQLSPDLQKVVQEAATEAAQFDLKTYKKHYDESLTTIKSKGIQVIDVDTSLWAKATQEAIVGLLKDIPNGQVLYDEIKASAK